MDYPKTGEGDGNSAEISFSGPSLPASITGIDDLLSFCKHPHVVTI